MFYPDTFQISTPSECEIRITRGFDAPRQLVFDAFTKPELVKRWLLGRNWFANGSLTSDRSNHP